MTKAENNLKNIRKAKGLTLEDLAALVGFDRGTISRHESGKRNLTIDIIRLYSDALQCSAADIIGDETVYTPHEQAIIDVMSKLSEQNKELVLQLATGLIEKQNLKSNG